MVPEVEDASSSGWAWKKMMVDTGLFFQIKQVVPNVCCLHHGNRTSVTVSVASFTRKRTSIPANTTP